MVRVVSRGHWVKLDNVLSLLDERLRDVRLGSDSDGGIDSIWFEDKSKITIVFS
jgi:hypothetical protein